MPSDLKVTEDRFVQAMQLRIKQSNETAMELKKLQSNLRATIDRTQEDYIDKYNELQDSINESNARVSAYTTALWEFREALDCIPGRAYREQKVQQRIDEVNESFADSKIASAVVFLLKELL